MQLTPLLISILLFVSTKLKPLAPTYQKITSSLVSLTQPINNLKNTVDQKKLFVSSLPNLHYNSLALKAENNTLKTQNLLLKNKLNLDTSSLPTWDTVQVRLIKTDQIITATSNQTDQIQIGMPLVQSTSLIGIVQKVESSIIYIYPLSNKNVFFPVQSAQDSQGDYVFQNNLPQMVNISSQSTPNKDDTIFTLPTEQIPEGLVVGQIGQTITKPSNPMQKVEIILTPDISQTNPIHIIIKP